MLYPSFIFNQAKHRFKNKDVYHNCRKIQLNSNKNFISLYNHLLISFMDITFLKCDEGIPNLKENSKEKPYDQSLNKVVSISHHNKMTVGKRILETRKTQRYNE